jgi:hypothetical protein
VEGVLAPRVEALLRSDGFVSGVSVALQAGRELQRHGARVTQRALHAMNQPTATDVARIMAEVRRLQGDIQRLSEQFARTEQDRTCRPATQPTS